MWHKLGTVYVWYLYPDHTRVKNDIHPLLFSYHNDYKFAHAQEFWGVDAITLLELIAREHLFLIYTYMTGLF